MQQTICRILRDTGRRPGEVVRLRVGCIDVINGQHNLIYDNHKARADAPPAADHHRDRRSRDGLGTSPLAAAHPTSDPPLAVPAPAVACQAGPRHVTAVCVGGALESLDAADRPDRRRAPRSRRAAPCDRARWTPSALRRSYATALVNAGVSLLALMALLGHVSAAMSLALRPTVRCHHPDRIRTCPRPGQEPHRSAARRPTRPAAGRRHRRRRPESRTRTQDRPGCGFCLRPPVQGACPYANICEHCPSFRTDSTHLPVLAAQRLDAQALAADAEARGWIEEADRHRRLIDRLDAVLAQAANT